MNEVEPSHEIPDEAITEDRLRTKFARVDEEWRKSSQGAEDVEMNQALAQARIEALDQLRAIGVDPTLASGRSADEETSSHQRVLDDEATGQQSILDELDSK